MLHALAFKQGNTAMRCAPTCLHALSQCVYHIESTCAYDLASYAAYAKLLFFFNFLIWSLEKYVVILNDPALICHANA